MRRFLLSVTLSFLPILASIAQSSGPQPSGPPVVLDVWPAGKVPGEKTPIAEESLVEMQAGNTVIHNRTIKRITNVSRPTITVHRPEAVIKDTGTAVVICPGGGYNILAWDLEGEEIAAWLNSIGVTGIILKYRVPRRPGEPKDEAPPGPLQDGQRAVSLVRSKADQWHINPKRIGILGFSAGGSLAARVSTNFDKRAYEAIDDVDKVSSRPDFTVLIYPALQYGVKDRDHLTPDIRVSKDTPPTFFAHASDDEAKPAPADCSALMYLALKQAGVPAELHIYASGGHGFGLRASDKPCTTWPDRCTDWLRERGLLGDAKARSDKGR
jgi:acetyl esterase/lipase